MLDRAVFAERLKSLRKSSGSSMDEVAAAIGVKNKSTISQFERMITAPSLNTFINLADYFDVSLDYLAGRSDDPTQR